MNQSDQYVSSLWVQHIERNKTVVDFYYNAKYNWKSSLNLSLSTFNDASIIFLNNDLSWKLKNWQMKGLIWKAPFVRLWIFN